MLVITAASMLTMEFLPKVPLQVFKVIPSSLMAILVAVLLEFALVRQLGGRTDTIRDVSEFTSQTAFPVPFFVDHASTGYDLEKLLTWSSAQGILVQGILLCVVGSIESLMTSEVVESFTKTPSHGDRSLFAMGLGNLVSGALALRRPLISGSETASEWLKTASEGLKHELLIAFCARFLGRHGRQCDDRPLDDQRAERRPGAHGAHGDCPGGDGLGHGRLPPTELHPGRGPRRHAPEVHHVHRSYSHVIHDQHIHYTGYFRVGLDHLLLLCHGGLCVFRSLASLPHRVLAEGGEGSVRKTASQVSGCFGETSTLVVERLGRRRIVRDYMISPGCVDELGNWLWCWRPRQQRTAFGRRSV